MRLIRFWTSTARQSHVGPGLEVRDDLNLAGRIAGGFIVQDVGGPVQLLLNEAGHAVIEVLRRGARIDRRDRDRGRRDDRILGHGQNGRASRPPRQMKMATTQAKIGRAMKKAGMTACPPERGRSRGDQFCAALAEAALPTTELA